MNILKMLSTMMPGVGASRLAIIQLALCPRNGPLPYIIQTSGEGGICLVDSSIHPYFAPKARRNNRKAPASPLSTRAGGADRDGHPGRVQEIGERQDQQYSTSYLSSPMAWAFALLLSSAVNARCFLKDHKEPEQEQSNDCKPYCQYYEREIHDQRRDHGNNRYEQGCHIQVVMTEQSLTTIWKVFQVPFPCDFSRYQIQQS